MQRAISMLGLVLALTGLIGVCEAFVPGVRQVGAQAGVRTMGKRGSRVVVKMSDDAPLRNMMRSARKPGPNDRVVEVNKPLGLVLEEDERGNVYVKQVQRGGNAARSGKIEEGDLISMISATFGDEMWSARGAGLGMIMQAIKVRQGTTVKLVLEATGEAAKKKQRAATAQASKAKAAEDAAKKEAALLKEMEAEDKGRKKFFGLF